MPSQSYRGHVIDVTCYSAGEHVAYLSNIHVIATGNLRHRSDSHAGRFASRAAAQDWAFREARSWVERFPLCWPFHVGGPA